MKYITKDGDTWNSIAYQFYGDPYLYEVIILENPSEMKRLSFPSGIVLEIPTIYVDETVEILPWQPD